MPRVSKRKGVNVRKVRDAKKILLTKVEELHYRAAKANVITFESAFSSCPRLKDYIKQD